MSQDDGMNGTDNVTALFPNKVSAIPIQAPPEVLKSLEDFALKAASGKFTGVAIIGFEGVGALDVSIVGAIPFRDLVAALEQVKFGVLARDYTAQLESQITP